MSETKPIMKSELSTRAYNVLVKTGLYSNSAMLTAQKVIEYFNSGNHPKDCGPHTKSELVEWAEKIVQNKQPEDMAYPQLKKSGDIAIQTGGLTKREWFTGMALIGFCANPNLSGLPKETFKLMAEEQADAMIKAGE